MISQAWEKVKKITIATIEGLFGIATEISYALVIMSVAFFICILLTFF